MIFTPLASFTYALYTCRNQLLLLAFLFTSETSISLDIKPRIILNEPCSKMGNNVILYRLVCLHGETKVVF
jgi:hypothetical protein